MNLKQRLNRIERSMNAIGTCPLCFGKGKNLISSMYEGDPIPEPPPGSGCQHCGAVNRMFIMYCDEGNPHAPRPPRTLSAEQMTELHRCKHALLHV